MCIGVVVYTMLTTVILARYQDPFEEYKTRLAKKLAKRAQAQQNGSTQTAPEKTQKDDMNWFGVKVGSTAATEGEAAGGVGKYLNLKRPQESPGSMGVDDPKKKRKIGFGDFSGW